MFPAARSQSGGIVPCRVGVSLGAIETSTFSGLRITLKLVGRPSRTSRVNWPEAPSLPLTATMRRIEGNRLIGPDAVPASSKLELGLVGVVGLDDQLLAESPQGHAGLELEVDPVPPLGLEALEFLGREGNRLGDDQIRLRCAELLDLQLGMLGRVHRE